MSAESLAGPLAESLIERITALESRLEFQDQTISQLNDALVVQQQKCFELEKSLKLLVDQMNERLPPSADPSKEPPPPHY